MSHSNENDLPLSQISLQMTGQQSSDNYEHKSREVFARLEKA